MPRRLRIAAPNVPMHIVQRGHNRSICFFERRDYRRYLDDLAELAGRFECRVHAFVLMTNHIHLLLTPGETGQVSALMKHLGQRHAQYVNRTYGRTGTLWEGRFRSCVVEEESYLLACHRYIEMNPVRAGIATHPRNYPWSSYRANADGDYSPVVAPHPSYLALGQHLETRLGAYRALFENELAARALDEIRRATQSNLVLGTRAFQRQIAATLGRRSTPGAPGRPRRGQTPISRNAKIGV